MKMKTKTDDDRGIAPRQGTVQRMNPKGRTNVCGPNGMNAVPSRDEGRHQPVTPQRRDDERIERKQDYFMLHVNECVYTFYVRALLDEEQGRRVEGGCAGRHPGRQRAVAHVRSRRRGEEERGSSAPLPPSSPPSLHSRSRSIDKTILFSVDTVPWDNPCQLTNQKRDVFSERAFIFIFIFIFRSSLNESTLESLLCRRACELKKTKRRSSTASTRPTSSKGADGGAASLPVSTHQAHAIKSSARFFFLCSL